MKRRILYAILGVVVISCVVIFIERIIPEKTKQNITTDISILYSAESPKLGNDKAPVLVTNIIDPECNNCARINADLKAIVRAYPDQVSVQVRYFFRHKNSRIAAMALEAARFQGRYWEMMDLMLTQTDWVHKKDPQEEKMVKFATDLGLDIARFKEDLRSSSANVRIQKDLEFSKSLGVRLAPLIFVGAKSLPKDNYEELDAEVKKEIERISTQR